MDVADQWPSSPFNGLAFVGEAPGEEEDAVGRPFVGPSGRILDVGMRTAGIARTASFVGNVFSSRPRGNDARLFFCPVAEAEEGGPHRFGRLGAVRRRYWGQVDRLRQAMHRLAPTVIVPLGGTALAAFTGSDNITEMRGAPMAAKYLAPGRKIVPTYHPAHVIKDWKLFPVFTRDLMRAVAEAAAGPEVRIPTIRAVIEPGVEDLREWEPRLLSAPAISVDIETGWGHILCIGFAPGPEDVLVVPFVDLRRADRCYWRTVEEEVEAYSFVRRVLESPVPKVGQNFAAFDAYWLWSKWRIGVRNCREDTRLLHHCLYPELPKSLAFMGTSYTDQGAWKTMRRTEKQDG